MARKPNRNGRGPGGSEANAALAVEWFAGADSEVASCGEWDIKDHLLREAVLLLLQAGRGIMFSLSWDQTEVRVTVYDGERKSARRVSDSIEFDDAMAAVAERARTLDKLPKREWGGK